MHAKLCIGADQQKSGGIQHLIFHTFAFTFQALSSNKYTTQMPNIVWTTLFCNTRLTITSMALDQWWCSSLCLSGDPLASLGYLVGQILP